MIDSVAWPLLAIVPTLTSLDWPRSKRAVVVVAVGVKLKLAAGTGPLRVTDWSIGSPPTLPE